MANTTTFLLWRWLVRLAALHGVVTVQAFVPSISCFPKQKIAFLRPPTRRSLHAPLSRSISNTKTFLQTKITETTEEYVEAEDLDGLQDLFNRYCDREGLMSKKAVQQIPPIAELLEDVSESEFREMWSSVDKFPEASNEKGSKKKQSERQEENERIDVDSFVKLYRAIDDLFEEDTTAIEANDTLLTNRSKIQSESDLSTTLKGVTSSDDDNDEEEEDPVMEQELESIYKQLCDAGGLLSKEKLRAWDEVDALFKEGLLGEDEFNRIWDGTKKSAGTKDMIDDQGFLYFNVALDDLFEFDASTSFSL